MATVALELDYTTPQPVGTPEIEFPYEANGDLQTMVITQAYKQTRDGFMADRFAGRYKPGAVNHPDYSNAWLNRTSKPETTATGLYRFTRSFCTVPVDQITYGPSRYIDMPSVPTTTAPAFTSYALNSTTGLAEGIGNAIIHYIGSNYYLWTPDNKFYGALNQGPVTYALASGGTFTLTYKSSTTAALAYNAADATIEAALDGLADAIADGITFTVYNFLGTAGPAEGSIELGINGGFTTSPVMIDASGLSPATARYAYTSVTNNAAQDIFTAALRTVTAHGYNTALDLIVANVTSAYIIPPALWDVVDANTIAYARNIIGPGDLSSIGYRFTGQYNRSYTPGLRLLGTKNTIKSYLPGVSAGITTGADIPVDQGMQSVDALMEGLVGATTGFQTYLTDGPVPWLEGPILQVTDVAINLDDIT